MRTPKNWSRVSPRNLGRVSNLWPALTHHISTVVFEINFSKLKEEYENSVKEAYLGIEF